MIIATQSTCTQVFFDTAKAATMHNMHNADTEKVFPVAPVGYTHVEKTRLSVKLGDFEEVWLLVFSIPRTTSFTSQCEPTKEIATTRSTTGSTTGSTARHWFICQDNWYCL